MKWARQMRKWDRAAQGADGDAFLDVRDLLTVSPAEIRDCSAVEFSADHTLGSVVPGDWDVTSKPFASLDIAVAVRDVFFDGRPWSETAFYRNLVSDLARGLTRFGIHSQQGIDARCEQIAELYGSIRSRGYLSADEASKDTGHGRSSLDEVSVAIGRGGDLLFADGAHRLAIAKALGIEAIPVVVAARHPEWMLFRKEIEAYVKEHGGAAYQPPLHPDLARVPAHHECENRFDLMRGATSSRGGRLLDIGANWGYFCHKFEDLGFHCVAVEDSPASVYFLTKLRDARRRQFAVVSESVLDARLVRETVFSVVLALNVFHHFLKTRAAFARFQSLLAALKTDEMFFEPHLEGEAQMRSAEAYLSPDELTRFVAESLGLRRIDLLGSDADGRSLFRMTRNG